MHVRNHACSLFQKTKKKKIIKLVFVSMLIYFQLTASQIYLIILTNQFIS